MISRAIDPNFNNGSRHNKKELKVNSDKQLKILLIEDNPADAKMVQLLLHDSDLEQHTLDVQSTLSEGLKAMDDNDDFDVVLLDLSLPDSNGFDTLKKLVSAQPNINVIVLTGHSDKQLGLEAVKLGAQDFLVKGSYNSELFSKTIKFAIERKKIKENLEEAQLRYQNIFTNSKDAIYVCDLNGDLIDYNEATSILTGYDKENLLGLNIKKFFEDSDFWDSFLERIMQSKFVVEEEIDLVCKNGSLKNCIIYAGKLEYGDFTGINGFITDITERKQAEKLREDRKIAEKTNKLKEQFIASISHEMRTPMNAILGMSNLVLKTKMNEEQFNYISSIKNSSELLLGIVNDILQISSIQNGKIKFEYHTFDLHDLLANLIAVMQYKVLEKNLEFNLEVSPTIPRYLIGDKLRLNQILYNLVGNAIKFTDEGKITIKVEELTESNGTWHIQFMVQDTGIGIPGDKIGVIFETFTRIRSKDRIYEGTGLGLSIAKNLIEYQGGKIWVESTIGEGSRFYFDLIFEQGEEPEAGAPVLETLDPMTSFSLLLAEDHPINRVVATQTLKKQFPNLTLTIAVNGKEAVEQVQENDFDIVLMDIQMPIMDGAEATQTIRKMDSEKANLPILAMTAHANIKENERYKDYGMDDYVLKPFEPEQLFHKISKHIRLKKTL